MKYILFSIIVFSMSIFINEASANAFGRLFTTQKERAYLDKIRKNYKFGRTVFSKTKQNSPRKKIVTKPVTFNGVVRRNNGQKEIWINGKKVSSSKNIDKSNRSKNRILIKQVRRKKYISVQPGQIIDPKTGVIVEPYQSLSQSSGQKNNVVNIKK